MIEWQRFQVGRRIAVLGSLLLAAIFFLAQLGNGYFKDNSVSGSVVWFWIVDVVVFIVLPLGMVFVAAFILYVRPKDVGLSNPVVILGGFRFVLITLVITLLYLSFSYQVEYFFWGWFPPGEQMRTSYNQVIPDGWVGYFVAIYLSLSAAIVEEVVYRGVALYVYTFMGETFCTAIVISSVSSLMFGLVHFENGVHAVITYALLGFVAVAVALRLNNIWSLVISHFVVLMSIYVR